MQEFLQAETNLVSDSAFSSVVHGDACPENYVTYGRSGVLIDLDEAYWGSTWLDIASFLLLFHTAWQVAQLPRDVTQSTFDA